jgi:hypothetical protein
LEFCRFLCLCRPSESLRMVLWCHYHQTSSMQSPHPRGPVLGPSYRCIPGMRVVLISNARRSCFLHFLTPSFKEFGALMTGVIVCWRRSFIGDRWRCWLPRYRARVAHHRAPLILRGPMLVCVGTWPCVMRRWPLGPQAP